MLSTAEEGEDEEEEGAKKKKVVLYFIDPLHAAGKGGNPSDIHFQPIKLVFHSGLATFRLLK